MRLLTRRIHRAFPELDRYSDEQCERFVRAARRAFWPRVGRVAVRMTGVLIWLALLVGTAWALGDRFVEDQFLTRSAGRVIAVIVLGTIIFMFIPLVGWLMWRDVQLRRRIRKILRARATCPGCGYQLLGLFVTAQHKVICPECAMETEVDPSLSELTTDEAGRARFNPAAAPPTWWQRNMTPRRKKWLRRGLIATLVFGAVSIPGGWTAYELFLRHQAALAKRERPGAAGMTALINKYQPSGTTSDSPNAIETLEQAILLQASVQSGLFPKGNPTTKSGREVAPDVSAVYGSYEGERDPEREETEALSREVGLKLLEAWRKGGVFDQLKKMAAQPRAVLPIDVPASEPLVSVLLPTLGPTRNLARACAARMHLARLNGDQREYLEALEELMALSRVTSQQPFLIDQLVSIAVEALGAARLHDLLATHPSEEWLNGIEGVLARQASAPPGGMFAGERLSVLDSAGWVFSDPDRVRWGKYSKGAQLAMWGGGGMVEGRLGTYVENRDAINKAFDEIDAEAIKPRYQRSTAEPEESRLVLLRVMMPSMKAAMRSSDQVELERRGVRVEIALERFRNQHGNYPAKLEDLVPGKIAAIPLDPWSGRPLGYKRIDPTTDEFGRGYLLYCVGADGRDDGGTPSKSRWEALMNAKATPALKGASGTDFIINLPSKTPTLKELQAKPDTSNPVEPATTPDGATVE